VASKTEHGQLLYLFHWWGCPKAARTWEPADQVRHDCSVLVEHFEDAAAGKQEFKKRNRAEDSFGRACSFAFFGSLKLTVLFSVSDALDGSNRDRKRPRLAKEADDDAETDIEGSSQPGAGAGAGAAVQPAAADDETPDAGELVW
jgi:hypothetical protein